MDGERLDKEFPCKLYALYVVTVFPRYDTQYFTRSADTSNRVIDIPFPDERLATTALKALSVDRELSPLVDRRFEVVDGEDGRTRTSLRVVYRATTNRMLRVSVNGFFESLRLVVQVMEELDVDVCLREGREDLTAVQGLGEAAAGV